LLVVGGNAKRKMSNGNLPRQARNANRLLLNFHFELGREKMSTKIDAIEKEIQKIEHRLSLLETEGPASSEEKIMHQSTVSLLKAVINDLRQEQERLRRTLGEANAGA
jgi:hypothetical protein